MKQSDCDGAARMARTLVKWTMVRAARLFLFIQPIISSICVVVVAVAVFIY